MLVENRQFEHTPPLLDALVGDGSVEILPRFLKSENKSLAIV